MCDYSLHHVANRPAKVGDKLVTTRFRQSGTRGFAATNEPNVAVCLLPGTEIAFDREVDCDQLFGFLRNRKVYGKLARFRQINTDERAQHHDALEFPDGEVVLLTRLCEGQHATVLQMPASRTPGGAEKPTSAPVTNELTSAWSVR
jgi:DNA-binding cell septation regulator SpoVG